MKMPLSPTPKAELVTSLRTDVNNFNDAINSFIAHRAEFVDKNTTFVIGDMTGVNSSTEFTAANMNQMVIDFLDIVTKIKTGGTISVGVWTNVIKVK